MNVYTHTDSSTIFLWKYIRSTKLTTIMGILSKLFGSKTTATYSPKSEQEAWIGIMYASMHIDDQISDNELEEMFVLLEKQPLFKGKVVADYYQPAMLADREIGSHNLIDVCAAHVSKNSKTFLFELTMKLLLADGKIKEKEKEIAEYLMKALQLEFAVARKIVDDLLVAE